MSDAVTHLKALLKDQPKMPLRPQQIADLKEERQRQESMHRAPAFHGVNKGSTSAAIRKIDAMLDSQTVKPVEPTTRDLIATKTREVIETVVKPAMLPHEVMRRNPTDAVDHFRRGENSPRVKEAILLAKTGMRVVEPENTDQDYTNFEKFRPRLATPGGAATYMVDAQIPGAFGMTTAAKANWPLGEPTVQTAASGAGYVPADLKAQQQAASLAGLGTVNRQCPTCQGWFAARTDVVNPRKYCGDACALKARTDARNARLKAKREGRTKGQPLPSPTPEPGT